MTTTFFQYRDIRCIRIASISSVLLPKISGNIFLRISQVTSKFGLLWAERRCNEAREGEKGRGGRGKEGGGKEVALNPKHHRHDTSLPNSASLLTYVKGREVKPNRGATPRADFCASVRSESRIRALPAPRPPHSCQSLSMACPPSFP
jgi:hypothetical protein